VVGEIATTAPEHTDVLAEQLEHMVDALVPHLPTHAQEKASKHSANRTAALGLVALLYGGLSLARATRGTALSDEILAACRLAGATLTHDSQQRPSIRKSRS
jgi:TetR/AcrR family transcriptional repressor of nem operon